METNIVVEEMERVGRLLQESLGGGILVFEGFCSENVGSKLESSASSLVTRILNHLGLLSH